LGLCEEADFEVQMFNLAQMFIRIPNVQFSTEPAFLQNPCYRFVLLFCRVVVCPCYSVLVRWLGGSFAKRGFSVGLCGFANVPPNGLAINQILSLLSFDVS
jgi:hypothetical protein